MKHKRSIVFLMFVVGAVALGIMGGITVAATAGSAHAHGIFGGGGGADGVSFASRVADKLNDALNLDEDITEAQVQAAFDGATADKQVSALEAKLDELEVEEATKTEITDWFDEYPYDDLIRLRFIGLANSDKVSSGLERLVEKEKITQTQSDGIQAWYDDRPDLPEGLERSGKGRHRGRDNDGAGTSFRGRHHGGGHGDGVGSFFRGRLGGGLGNGNNSSGNPL